MNPLLTEVRLDNEQRQDDTLRRAGLMDMSTYASRLEDRKVERKMAKMRVMVVIRGKGGI